LKLKNYQKKIKIEIPENIKYDIGYWLTNIKLEIVTEEEKKFIKEIREKLNLKKVYDD